MVKRLEPSRSVKQNAAPIGLFDSGMGGLTVLREVYRQLPSESVILLWRHSSIALWEAIAG